MLLAQSSRQGIVLSYCFVCPYIYHLDFPPNNKRLGMPPFLTCQKKVLEVKRKNKRSWRGFEAERVSDSSAVFQRLKNSEILEKREICINSPFHLEFNQKYNTISQNLHLL